MWEMYYSFYGSYSYVVVQVDLTWTGKDDYEKDKLKLLGSSVQKIVDIFDAFFFFYSSNVKKKFKWNYVLVSSCLATLLTISHSIHRDISFIAWCISWRLSQPYK